MSKLHLSLRLLALVLCFSIPLTTLAQSSSKDEGKKEKSADDEIDDLIGPTYAETMTVTATRKETSIMNAPVSISVVGQRELETTAADNYADLLRGVPGVTAMQASAREVHVKSRGAASTLETSQLTLVDGRHTFEDILRISSQPRLLVGRLLADLIEAGDVLKL